MSDCSRDFIRKFNGAYSYVTQLVSIHDEDLFNEYQYTLILIRLLPRNKVELIDIDDKVKLEYAKLTETFNGAITLKEKPPVFMPNPEIKAKVPDKRKDTLQSIIDRVNERFDGKFTDSDRVIVEGIYQMFMRSPDVKKFKKYAKDNSTEMFVQSLFPDKFKEIVTQCFIENKESFVKEVKRKYSENREVKKIKERKLPKLHIDYEARLLDFNGKQISINPRKEAIISDIKCLTNYFQGFSSFNGSVLSTQKNYFVFMNWFFASVFMPYLRLTAHNNNYEMIPFPVFGIIYGDSNGGKSTFTRLLSKMMCGHKVPLNSSNDFTSTEIESLKRGREGLPIVIDDLAKMQFQNNNEKIIKDDEWGIPEKFINYPAVVITTNKLPSITPDISKRAVTCHIDAKINKEAGAKNSKRINDSMKSATTAFFGEYVRIMLGKIDALENSMKTEEDYFPDVFQLSSETISEIFTECGEQLPEYFSKLTFSDYFGDKAVSRNAMEKIVRAWENEPKQFKIDKRANKLIYSCGENGNVYALKYIYDELPPALNAQLNATNLVMDLDQAQALFGKKFKKKIFG